MIQKTTLPNGLRIVTEAIDYVESASIGIDVLVGSRDETDTTRGISHVLEHMMFKGTDTHDQLAISQAWDMMGGSQNAYTSQERTMYFGSVLAKCYPEALSLLSQMFLNASMKAEELEIEKGAILREIESREDDPDSLVFELFNNKFWPDHNLGQDLIGNAATVSSFTRDDLVQYRNSKYTPDVIVISAVGKIDHDQVVSYVEKEFAHLTGSCANWRTPNRPAIAQTFDVKVKRPIQLAYTIIGYPAYNRYDPKRYTASVISAILGGSMSSRLFQEIREKRGLAYTVFADTVPSVEGGAFYTGANTEAKSVKTVVGLIDDELKKMTDTPISEDDLVRIKNAITGGTVISQERMSARMQHNSKSELYYDKHITMAELLEHYNAITVQDVQSVAQELFDPKKKSVLTLGPTLSKKT